MTTDDDIASLLERVKAATGPDRDLDLALATALVPNVVVLRRNKDDTANEPHTYWEYTGNMDDAFALVERVLPGLCPGVSQSVFHLTWSAWLGDQRDGAAYIVADATHDISAPLAILAALLTSLKENHP